MIRRPFARNLWTFQPDRICIYPDSLDIWSGFFGQITAMKDVSPEIFGHINSNRESSWAGYIMSRKKVNALGLLIISMSSQKGRPRFKRKTGKKQILIADIIKAK
ncbi:MAG: hypothetical protein BAA01_00195 [Bacillus thermozeamaize]|uniref:Uncharacterized protein n=1 Tax=Bacillus thermozeamaize TaxID=230954 RepID=A0A1Y3PCC9_9BACI|nr:MAG: hypothetical protein BAA01_00195 [Bacillus thermozeamaize]